MLISEFKRLAASHRLRNVNFIESGCGPMVVEVEFDDGKELIRDNHGEVLTYANVTQAYDLCHKVGIHNANLVQVVPHDETGSGTEMDYHRESTPLKF